MVYFRTPNYTLLFWRIWTFPGSTWNSFGYEQILINVIEVTLLNNPISFMVQSGITLSFWIWAGRVERIVERNRLRSTAAPARTDQTRHIHHSFKSDTKTPSFLPSYITNCVSALHISHIGIISGLRATQTDGLEGSFLPPATYRLELVHVTLLA